MRKSGLLDGKQAIKDFLCNASDYMLNKWVGDGMPVRIDCGRWYAHTDNLEDFFRFYTKIRQKSPVLDDVKSNNPEITPK